MLRFIAESKNQINLKARNTIAMVEEWQRDTCSKFDIIQQHIVESYNTQIANDTTQCITRAIPKTPKVGNINTSPANDASMESVTTNGANDDTAESMTCSPSRPIESPKFPSMPSM